MSFKSLLTAKLDTLGNKYTISANEIRTTCLNPEHKDNSPSYFINTLTGVSHCFSCGYAPHPAKLIDCTEEDTAELLRQAKYSTLLDNLHQEVQHKEKVQFTLPPKAYDIDKNWRGVTKDLLLQLGAYYCNTGRYAGRLVFPIYNLSNELVGYDARIVNPSVVPEYVKDVKWLRPAGMAVQDITYPVQLLQELGASHIIITEGLMDAISYLQMGVPALPSFGLSSPSSERVSDMIRIGCESVSIATDNDIKGQEAAKRLYKDYVKWFKVKSHPISTKVFLAGQKDASIKDANDYLVKIYNQGGK